jgi:hypothetical protein
MPKTGKSLKEHLAEKGLDETNDENATNENPEETQSEPEPDPTKDEKKGKKAKPKENTPKKAETDPLKRIKKRTGGKVDPRLKEQIPEDLDEPQKETSIVNPGRLMPSSQLITCPQSLEPAIRRENIFIYGAMTKAPQWQQEVVEWLKPYGFYLLWPRRWNDRQLITDKEAIEQKEWEHEAFGLAERVILWFGDNLQRPMVFYYLAMAALQSKKYYVGVHPNYSRVFDVEQEAKYLGIMEIHKSLRNLCKSVIEDIKKDYAL